jgi:hypothetical protein
MAGWVLPALPGVSGWPLVSALAQSPAGAHLDTVSILGAAITTLAVIIAVVIGYNVAAIQISGQTHSLAITRAILRTLGPLILVWLFVTGVALIYLAAPPTSVGGVWQILLWFGAVAFLMIAYLWTFPWKLSGEYAATWSVRDLRQRRVREWESADGFAVLQAGMAGANARRDLTTARSIATVLGTFLTGVVDPAAERANAYDRSSYRSLKNLLTGSAEELHEAPTTIAYYVGFITAGVLLQAAATGYPLDYGDSDLFSGLIRATHRDPDRIGSLWAGVRHSLCRDEQHAQGTPFLVRYWRAHSRWAVDDGRRTQQIAIGLVRLFSDCWVALRHDESAAQADTQALDLLNELYRYIATYLTIYVKAHPVPGGDGTPLPTRLLAETHERVLAIWPADATASRAQAIAAYERYRGVA